MAKLWLWTQEEVWEHEANDSLWQLCKLVLQLELKTPLHWERLLQYWPALPLTRPPVVAIAMVGAVIERITGIALALWTLRLSVSAALPV